MIWKFISISFISTELGDLLSVCGQSVFLSSSVKKDRELQFIKEVGKNFHDSIFFATIMQNTEKIFRSSCTKHTFKMCASCLTPVLYSLLLSVVLSSFQA